MCAWNPFVLPPKDGLFESKQGTFGFRVYIYIYIQYLHIIIISLIILSSTSTGLLPAIGVGAAVYIVTGWITLPTLGLVWKPSFIGKMLGETLGMVGKWLEKPLGWWENGGKMEYLAT